NTTHELERPDRWCWPECRSKLGRELAARNHVFVGFSSAHGVFETIYLVEQEADIGETERELVRESATAAIEVERRESKMLVLRVMESQLMENDSWRFCTSWRLLMITPRRRTRSWDCVAPLPCSAKSR